MEEWKFTVTVEVYAKSPAYHWRLYRDGADDRRKWITQGEAHTESEAIKSAEKAARDHKAGLEVLSFKRHEFTL